MRAFEAAGRFDKNVLSGLQVSRLRPDPSRGLLDTGEAHLHAQARRLVFHHRTGDADAARQVPADGGRGEEQDAFAAQGEEDARGVRGLFSEKRHRRRGEAPGRLKSGEKAREVGRGIELHVDAEMPAAGGLHQPRAGYRDARGIVSDAVPNLAEQEECAHLIDTRWRCA